MQGERLVLSVGLSSQGAAQAPSSKRNNHASAGTHSPSASTPPGALGTCPCAARWGTPSCAHHVTRHAQRRSGRAQKRQTSDLSTHTRRDLGRTIRSWATWQPDATRACATAAPSRRHPLTGRARVTGSWPQTPPCDHRRSREACRPALCRVLYTGAVLGSGGEEGDAAHPFHDDLMIQFSGLLPWPMTLPMSGSRQGASAGMDRKVFSNSTVRNAVGFSAASHEATAPPSDRPNTTNLLVSMSLCRRECRAPPGQRWRGARQDLAPQGRGRTCAGAGDQARPARPA